jgi:hypothetical protein
VLLRILEGYVPRYRKLDTRLQKTHRRWLRKLGLYLACLIPCWNYEGVFPLTPAALDEWAVLDTFDALSARYDYPQTLEAMRQWFEQAGLTDVDVRLGGNGIVGTARKALP